LRGYDTIVRYGGDEFVCTLPGGTANVASGCIARARIRLGELIPGATFTAGMAQMQPGDGVDEVIARADAALYQARIAGQRRPASAPRRFVSVDAAERDSRQRCPSCGEWVLPIAPGTAP
jgi:PleD family two-component response regulator